MGFKKTSEGRVFFQSHDQVRGDVPPPANKATPNSDISVTNMQVVGLLRALNEKLQSSQIERRQMRMELDHYRRMVEDMKTISAAPGTAGSALRELEEARKLMLQIEKKADRADQGMSKLQAQMLETVQQQSKLAKTVQETKAEQAKVVRQVSKAVDDRARFMRKIERIEEAVLQTQEALNTRATTFLPHQAGASNDTPLDMDEKGRILSGDKAQPKAATSENPVIKWWQQSAIFNPASTAMLVLLAALLGWSLSRLPEQTASINATRDNAAATLDDIRNLSEESWTAEEEPASYSSPYEEPEQTEYQSALNDFEEPQATEPAVTPEPEAPEPLPPVRSKADDLGTVDLQDDKKLLELLENDPEALATQLNNIEPSAKTATAIPTPEPVRAKPAPAPEPVKPASTKPLEEQIKPDPNLPAMVQDIQNQAYQGVPEAQHDLAAIYTAGHGGVGQDYKRAAFWFEQAANQNIANAAYNLGVLYHQGLGTKKDIAKAIQWYTKAASLDHPEAQYNLGIAYIEGIGVAYDPEKATRYFENAANQNVTEAAYNLGLIYENGLLGQPKPDEALMWYKTAADKGSPEASEALRQLAKSLNIDLEDVNRIADGVKTQKKTDLLDETPVSPPAAVKKAEIPVQETESPSTMAQIQELLMREGLFPGPADGIPGPIVRDAIRSYQAQNNLGITGIADQSLLAHMLAKSRSTMPEYGSREQ